jgi:hypothetical protein
LNQNKAATVVSLLILSENQNSSTCKDRRTQHNIIGQD